MRYWFFIFLVIGLLCPDSLRAGDRTFTKRFSTNDTGDIVFVGNTLMTLSGVSPTVAANVQNAITTGTAANNNSYFMEYVDVDSTANLGNSSTAALKLPAGSTVLWAGLYWGANLQLAGTGSPTINSSSASQNKIKFKTPGSGTYETLTASATDDVAIDTSTDYGHPYSSFVEITDLVKSGGNGIYSAGQVLAARGINRYAVWTMVVVYRTPNVAPKNLTVFDGFKVVRSATGFNQVDISITGFTAPPTGPVNVKLGVMSYEGDYGYEGDKLWIGPTTGTLKEVTDDRNLSNNFANSTISYMGHYAGTQPDDPGYPVNPHYYNNLGVDADIMAAPTGAVLNNGTSTIVRFTTSLDAYYPTVLTTSIDLYAPQVQASKTVVHVGEDNVTPGDTLTYTIKFKNRPESELNGDATKDTVLEDILPEEVTYVPGTLKVVRVAQTAKTALTDVGDSDDGEFSNVVVGGKTREKLVVRLGHPFQEPNHNGGGSPGGVGTTGGVVKQGEEAIVTFDVRVKLGTKDGVKITNEATIGYKSLAKGIAFVASVAPVTVSNSKVITGVVFEDMQYGGGAGRGPLQAPVIGPAGTLPFPAGAKPIPNARVELYGPKDGDPVAAAQKLLEVTTTDASGVYTFPNINNTGPTNDAKDYTVRVVSSTVTSTRGSATGLLPVQTYRTKTEVETSPDGELSKVVPVADMVGGENPGVADGPAIFTIDTVLPANAQNVAKIRVTGADLLRVDFGFNFDTVVNTNDSGQGSLRQVILNANALPNAGLAQVGFTAGIENVIFMISNGVVLPGLRSSNDYFTGAFAKIAPSTALPPITDALSIDGRKQPPKSDPASTAKPLIYINGTSAGAAANGFSISTAAANGSTLHTLSIGGFDGSGILITTAANNVIKGNLIGQDPSGAAVGNKVGGISINTSTGNIIGGAAAGEPNVIINNGRGVAITGGSGNLIKGNLIGQDVSGVAGGNTGAGVVIDASTANAIGGIAAGESNVIVNNGSGVAITTGSGNVIKGNLIGQDASGVAGGNIAEGILIKTSVANIIGGATAADRNAIVNNKGTGVVIDGGSTNQIKGNRIGLNTNGTAAGNTAGGVLINASVSNSIGGINAGEGNVIAYNGTTNGATTGGVFIVTGTTNGIRRNSIYQNKGLGIDLAPVNIQGNGGTAANVNGAADYPVLTSVSLTGTTLTLNGQTTKKGKVEIFKVNDDGDQHGKILSTDSLDVPHGEGEIYLGEIDTNGSGKIAGTVTIPSGLGTAFRITMTATDDAGNTSEFSPNYAVGNIAKITGTVFEDPNYPGGAGRSMATGSGVGVQGATVELYKKGAPDTLIATTTTDTSGAYSFDEAADTEYKVRVVNATVRSSRAGYISGLLPVQTFRTNMAAAGTVTGVKDYVGGENPAIDDTAVGVLTITTTAAPQSVASVFLGAKDTITSGVDFGFNFNTVVNTRDTGQGSLRQFILNANALTGADTAIFMISNGTTGNGGMRTTLNYFTGGIAPIPLVTALPAITEQAIISGANQPGYTVSPVIEVNGSLGAATGFTISGGSGSVIDSLAINRFATTAIAINGLSGSNVITANRIGTDAAGITAPMPKNGKGIVITGSPNNTIGDTLTGKGNILSGNSSHGVQITGSGASGNKLFGNLIGLASGGSGALANGGSGVSIENGATQSLIGGGSAGAENKIAYNGAGGIVIKDNATLDNSIQRNSIWANIGLGIDLGVTGVTPNTGSTGSIANRGMNYPIFTASNNGSTLRIIGFVGSVSGQAAFSNATIDLYKANNTPSDQNGPIIVGDGLSVPHGEGQTYIGTITADGSGKFDTTISAPGFSGGDTLTATATGSSGSTSEFSANVQLTVSVSGAVYRDANRDGHKNDDEAGTGLVLFAKLLNGTAGPAIQTVPVDPTTGKYEFPSVAPGTWTVLINGDAGGSQHHPSLSCGLGGDGGGIRVALPSYGEQSSD